MRARHAVFVPFVLLGCPAVGAAGPIQFQLMPTGLWIEPGNPAIAAGLVPITPLNVTYTYDPLTGTPTAVAVVAYDPARVPPPPSNPSGVSHWNNAGPFRVELHLTDAASGESADFSLKGHIHMYGNPGKDKWGGSVYFQFLDRTEVTLGDYTYFVWGINDKDAGPATVDVRVEPNAPHAPPPHFPEPGTLLLAALALAPLGLRRLWK